MNFSTVGLAQYLLSLTTSNFRVILLFVCESVRKLAKTATISEFCDPYFQLSIQQRPSYLLGAELRLKTTKKKVFQFSSNFLWIGRRGKKLKKLEESISKFEFDLFHCEGKLFNRYYNFEVRFVCKFCKLPFHSSSSSLQRHNQGNVSNKSCEAQSQFNVRLSRTFFCLSSPGLQNFSTQNGKVQRI